MMFAEALLNVVSGTSSCEEGEVTGALGGGCGGVHGDGGGVSGGVEGDNGVHGGVAGGGVCGGGGGNGGNGCDGRGLGSGDLGGGGTRSRSFECCNPKMVTSPQCADRAHPSDNPDGIGHSK